MKDFDYHRPGSLEEALEALRSTNGSGKLLAGGQSLLPLMKLDLAEPGALVSLADVAELKGIRREGGPDAGAPGGTGDALVVGAAATHADVAASDTVAEAVPALAELAGAIGDPQVRNKGTLGGSIAHADPAADYPAALVGLGATVVTDRREIAAEDFFVGMFTTALEPDEIITSVRFPVPECAAYAKFANPASKYALAGVMVARGVGGGGGESTGGGSGAGPGGDGDASVRVAVTGAGPSVFRATAMEEALAADFSAGALEGLAIDPSDLLDDDDASADYRAHLVGVMARRAVEECG